ncbi:MAG: divalent metal cation transporter, partial [Algicola sp.]|nr:divalent metal cation transporter [Algicola sp.]
IVTAGIAASLFQGVFSIEIWTVIVLAICLFILLIGKYKLLDKLIKLIIITLTISTIAAVCFALINETQTLSLQQTLPKNSLEIGFLIAFMGWMPAPLDISVWHSLWTLEKEKSSGEFSPKSALFDFNVGYIGTIILGLAFVALGALVMFNSGETFSSSAGAFADQLLNMYTNSLGKWAYVFIGIAAFTTMFSTTLTTLDASPRAMARTTQLLAGNILKKGYLFWILILTVGTIIIFFLFASGMGLLIKIATILSFLTAPFYAIINYVLISSKHTPEAWRPSKGLHFLSILGIVFLISFSIWYLIY